jgi:hypothetical protein
VTADISSEATGQDISHHTIVSFSSFFKNEEITAIIAVRYPYYNNSRSQVQFIFLMMN